MTMNTLLMRVLNVSRHYPSEHPNTPPRNALAGVSLDAHRGEVLTILGLNGAGKSTLVKLIAGLLSPDSGEIVFADSVRKNRSELVGAVFEGNRNIYWRLTCFENLEYFGVVRGLTITEARARSRLLLERFNLLDRAKTIAAKLSRGMQQRLAIAISMVHHPELLVLDEPTLGVDIENVLEIVKILKTMVADGVSVILTSHQMEVVEMVADKVSLLVEGHIVVTQPLSQFMRHSEEAQYVIHMDEVLSAGRRLALSQVGAECGDSDVRVPAEQIYQVIDILKPLRFSAISPGTKDLTSTFIEKVKEYSHD